MPISLTETCYLYVTLWLLFRWSYFAILIIIMNIAVTLIISNCKLTRCILLHCTCNFLYSCRQSSLILAPLCQFRSQLFKKRIFMKLWLATPFEQVFNRLYYVHVNTYSIWISTKYHIRHNICISLNQSSIRLLLTTFKYIIVWQKGMVTKF